MPSLMGGQVLESESLRNSLLSLVADFRRKPIADAAGLVAALVAHEAEFRLEQEDALTANPWPSVEKYLKSLRAARAAYLEIPSQLQEVMNTLLPYTGSSLLPEQILKQLFVEIYGAGSRDGLPEWRRDGLSSHDYWGLDLEMLDLLIAAAAKMVDECECDPYTRARPDLLLVKRLFKVCAEFGMQPSAAEKSHFYRVVSAVLAAQYPKASYKALIKEVISIKG